MAEKGESSGHQHRPPMTGEFAIPTVSERKEQEKQIQEETQRSADEAFKKRQIDISHEQSVTNRRIATYTLILAILGGLGNGIAVYNSKLSRDVARHAERELEASIAQNRLDQRAWMGLEGVAFDKPQPGKAFPIVIRIRNSGKTPALDVTSIATLEAVGRLSHGPTYNCSDQGDVGRAVTAPNGIWDISLDGAKTTKSVLQEPDYRLLTAGDATLYVYATVAYNDIFGTHHWTSICAHYTGVHAGFSACDKYNEVDQAERSELPWPINSKCNSVITQPVDTTSSGPH